MTKLTQFYKQRAKNHWATKGDKNTKYFHISLLKRRSRNMIVSLKILKGTPHSIHRKLLNVLLTISNTFSVPLILPISIIFKGFMRVIQDEFTNSIPQKEEICEILKNMRSDTSPGLDGSMFLFIRLHRSGLETILRG